MKHPLASHLSLRSLATIVATLLGQAFADGLDRAPILPKTHAAPAPLSPLAATLDAQLLLPGDQELLDRFLALRPGPPTDGDPTDWSDRLRVVLGAAPAARADVHSNERHSPPAPVAPTLLRSP